MIMVTIGKVNNIKNFLQIKFIQEMENWFVNKQTYHKENLQLHFLKIIC